MNLTVGEESTGGKAKHDVDLVQLDLRSLQSLQSHGPHEVTVTFDGRERWPRVRQAFRSR